MELRSVYGIIGGDMVVGVREDFRRKGVAERVGGRRWMRRERRSVAAEEVDGLGWVVEGVGGGADVVVLGKWCGWWF